MKPIDTEKMHMYVYGSDICNKTVRVVDTAGLQNS